MVGLDPAAQRGELGDQRIDDGGAAPLDDRPAVAVGQRGEETGEDARERRRERQHGVGGRARHQCPPLVGAEALRHLVGGGQGP